jgi:6-phosphogluconolactonase
MSYVYIGTQDSGTGSGFQIAEFDSGSGVLSRPKLIEAARDPSIFLFNADGTRLYTCNSRTPGGLSAYVVNRHTGALSLQNAVIAEGRGPSHVSLDRTGRFVLDANYGGGYVEVFAIRDDGGIGSRTAVAHHTGRSVDPERQTRPYAHAIKTDPTNRFALACDLGTDQIVVYHFDERTGALAKTDPSSYPVEPGSGPRHLSWHPNGSWLYVVMELKNTVVLYAWDAGRGILVEQQTVSTLPGGFTGKTTAAEIAVHPSGRWVYASNRGADSIAVFAVDSTSGRLTAAGHVSAQGRTPRYFAFDPTARWLIVSNIDTDNVAVFAIDGATGGLTPHRDPVPAVRPHGIAFLPPAA